MQSHYTLRYMGDGMDSLDKRFIYRIAQDVPCSPIVHIEVLGRLDGWLREELYLLVAQDIPCSLIAH